MLLTDENYKAVCQYPRQKLGQPIWDALLQNTALPLEVIQSYNQAYLSDQQPYYRPFYSDQGPSADCPRIYGEIHAGGRIFGYVGIFLFDNPLLPDDLPATQVLLDALAMLLAPRRSRERASLSAYLLDLLDEAATPEAKALAYRCLPDRVPGTYVLMATPIGSTASQHSFAYMAISKIALEHRYTVSAIYQGCVVTLFGKLGEELRDKDRARFRRVAEFLSPLRPTSGVSPCFRDLTQLHGRFQQAHMTALTAQGICAYFEEAFPAPLFQVVGVHADPERFVHPVLYQMLAYDKENQTEYFRTLQVYSLTLHNKESTSRILCIHRNTLLYRLGKIGELFHIPYEEQRMAFGFAEQLSTLRGRHPGQG